MDVAPLRIVAHAVAAQPVTMLLPEMRSVFQKSPRHKPLFAGGNMLYPAARRKRRRKSARLPSSEDICLQRHRFRGRDSAE